MTTGPHNHRTSAKQQLPSPCDRGQEVFNGLRAQKEWRFQLRYNRSRVSWLRCTWAGGGFGTGEPARLGPHGEDIFWFFPQVDQHLWLVGGVSPFTMTSRVASLSSMPCMTSQR